MSISRLTRPVMVGVDGSEDGLRAVAFAVQEAARRGTGLRVVNVAQNYVPVAPTTPVLDVYQLEESTKVILEAAVHEAERVDPFVPVESLSRIGATLPSLLAAGEDARLIVLGHRSHGLVGRILRSRTTAGVASRAACPVVSVPATWTSGTDHGRVVAAIDGSPASRDVLRVGFEEADLRGAELVVLHAWQMSSAHDDLVVPESLPDEWRNRTEPLVSEILAGCREEYPDQRVTVDLRYERTADALVAASGTADLLVVGRHGHGGLLAEVTGALFGSLPRSMLQHAHCPLVITPHD